MMRTLLTTMAAALLGLLAVGCDENVTAVTGTDMPFTLYGLLTPDLDTQKVLVYPIEGTLQLRDTEAIDAAVRSVNLETGREYVWRDSLIRGADSLYEHVFQAPFSAEYGQRYRLSLTRSDGSSTTAETTIPPRTTVSKGEATVFPGVVTLPVRVEGGAPRIHHAVITYFATYYAVGAGPHPLEVPVSYDRKQKRVGDIWEIPVDLRRDYRRVEEAGAERTGAGLDRTIGITLHYIGVRLVVGAEDWDPPDGRFDPEVIVQPGVMSNVENGYGFLAAGYRHNVLLDPPPDDVLRAAGFAAADE